LFLSDQNLVGTLPLNFFGDLKNLVYVFLSRNNLSGSIPDSIGKLHRVNELGLHNNNFSGVIPTALSELVKLNYLSLKRNRLTGSLEPLSGCVKLLAADLSENDFTGSIPKGMCQLSKLVHLNFSRNAIDSLPACWGALNMDLVSLDMSWNRLRGPLPVAAFQHVLFVRLNANNLGVLLAPGAETSQSLELLDVSNCSLSGRLPDSLFAAGRLRSLDISHNSFSGVVQPSICDASSLEFLFIQRNKLSGPLPSCLFDSATLPKLTTFTMSCQAADILPYQTCPLPFGMAPSGSSGSMAALLEATRSLARTDVEITSVEDASSPRVSLLPDYKITASGVTYFLATFCGILFLLLGLLLRCCAHKAWCGHRSFESLLAGLDRYPQLGFVKDTVEGKLQVDGKSQTYEQIHKEPLAATAEGGVLGVLIKAFMVIFVARAITQYCVEGLVEESTTNPKPKFLPPLAINFTLALRAANSDSQLVITRVSDPWLHETLLSRGISHANTAKLISPGTTAASYTFPLGWTADDRTRVVSVWVSAEAVTNASGIHWQLQSGFKKIGGEPPNNELNKQPYVKGVISTITTSQQTCTSFGFTVIALNDNRDDITDEEIAEEAYIPIPGRNKTAIRPSKCTTVKQIPESVVPGRHAPQALNGPDRLLCLTEARLFIVAVPRTQKTPPDFFGNTEKFERKSFDLAQTGITTTIDSNSALKGLWQNTKVAQCQGCSVATACDDIKLTIVLSRNLFGVDESLEREKDALAFGPALLASCTSVLAIFAALYLSIDFLHNKRYKENQLSDVRPTVVAVDAVTADTGSTNGNDEFSGFRLDIVNEEAQS
jgi:hypothetical protein